jgi:L-ribulose-5-phosphate 3-epimerase
MKLGIVIQLGGNLREEITKSMDMGISTCQLICWDPDLFTEEMVQVVNNTIKEFDFGVTALWVGWQGPCVWNHVDGPLTIGLVPTTYRFDRIKTLELGARFANKIGVRDVITHVGFIPENPHDSEYYGLINSLKYLVTRLAQYDCNFLFETGQETPVTLLRTINEIGMSNVGINLDPANLILYGKGNPVDALDVFGQYILGVHAKDGLYPNDGYTLGSEVPLGEGKVDFEKLIPKLYACGYRGAVTIEREISGEQQIKDIMKAKRILDKIISSLPKDREG